MSLYLRVVCRCYNSTTAGDSNPRAAGGDLPGKSMHRRINGVQIGCANRTAEMEAPPAVGQSRVAAYRFCSISWVGERVEKDSHALAWWYSPLAIDDKVTSQSLIQWRSHCGTTLLCSSG